MRVFAHLENPFRTAPFNIVKGRVIATTPPTLTGNSIAQLLTVASEKTAKYEWIAAAQTYEEALAQHDSQTNPRETASMEELVAKCYFKGAFQSKNHQDFLRLMQLAETNHNNAVALYNLAGAPGVSRACKARALFSTYWLEEDRREKSSTIEQCIRLSDEAIKTLEAEHEKKTLAETYLDELTYLMEAFWLANEWEELEEAFEKGVETGMKAVDVFREIDEPQGYLETLNLTVRFLTNVAFYAAGPATLQERQAKVEVLVARAVELSEKVRTSYAKTLAVEASALSFHFLRGDRAKALGLFEAAASEAQSVKDSYLTGRLLTLAAVNAFWAALAEDDIGERRALLERESRLASSAVEKLKVSMQVPMLAEAYFWIAEAHNYLALNVEGQVEKKILQLRKAEHTAREGIELSQAYDKWAPTHTLAKALYFLSTLEKTDQERMRLLKEALPIREKIVQAVDQRENPQSWDRGVMRNWLALVKAELSRVEQDPQTRIGLMEGATRDLQECIDFCVNWAKTPDYFRAIANYLEGYGDILLELYRLTRKSDSSSKAINTYEDAILFLEKSGRTVPVAPIAWKIARVHDTIGDYKKSSVAFNRAAEGYRAAARKIPGSAPVFQELASYMDSWTLIERARVYHGIGEYSLASENYAKAANILHGSTTWSHLSKHYSACSLLETGEVFSSHEKLEQALETFGEARREFQEAKADLERALAKGPGAQEHRELADWIKITEGREKYSTGREELEEAKVLDRKGDEEGSLGKYTSAAESFRGLLSSLEQTRGELDTLALFCEAWVTMKQAERKASPEQYAKAAEIFVKARDSATSEKFGHLALGNSFICRALEAGTQFRLSQDTSLYSEVKKNLSTAAEYYEHGSFENAAEWTHATQRLFDALVYLADAEVEREPKKKTEFFHLAEKHLELAGRLYDAAGFPKKRDEATRQLKKVREEKEILLTPIEALAQNPAVSGVSVAPVTLVRDQALGLERFDEANVVGNLDVHQKEVEVGTNITFNLEMANVGKTPATLLKLANVSPEGLELDREKSLHRTENGSIDMKGKRLEYLKTHEVKLVLKTLRKGAFELKPKVFFVDERGNYKSYEFEPASVIVRELGIKGWIKGPSK